MRGKAWLVRLTDARLGITPAYAGKRHSTAQNFASCKDHPRVCGEKCRCSQLSARSWGSPPRMRGKVISFLCCDNHVGITPAYAGKSLIRTRHMAADRDHPRVCGEKFLCQVFFFHGLGSPPRMRGKAVLVKLRVPHNRITPAYAGKRSVGPNNIKKG